MSHYYERLDDGAVIPRHFVPMSTREGDRPTRITDVKKAWREGRLWVPSVTTVLSVLAKPALTRWLIDQHLQTAHRMGYPYEDCDAEDWSRRVKQAADAEMAKAPDAGTDMHKVLEDWWQGGTPDDMLHQKICNAVGHATDDNCHPPGRPDDFMDEWHTERYFTHPLGFGGCADLVGDGWVIDYKTKQTADKFKPGRMAYDDHRMQLAAYRMGFGMPQARAANIFICLETGEIDFHEHSQDELAKGWELFTHALAIWQLRNDFPAMKEAA